ncbi:MAG: hypothetical protein IJK64_03500 [Clostridia bacterium]|nr:hypothetical protein [Clostridia bacterium]
MKLIDQIYVTEDVTLFSISDITADIGHMAAIFRMIAEKGIDVDMISQTPSSGTGAGFSFTVSDSDFSPVLAIASEIRARDPKAKINVSNGNCKLTVSGEAMRGTPGVSAKVFQAAADVGADVRMVTTSEIEIALLVFSQDVQNVIDAINAAFAE